MWRLHSVRQHTKRAQANMTHAMSYRTAPRSMVARVDHCALLDNDAGSDTCDWWPPDVCHGSTRQQCICSGISYVVWAACDACPPDPIDTSWDDYSHTDHFGCTGLPQPFPLPYPTGTNAFPSWAFDMIAATPTPTTFDLSAASAFALSPSTPDPTPDPTTDPTPNPTPDPPTSSPEQSSTTSTTPLPTTAAPITPTTSSTTKSSITSNSPSSAVSSSFKHITGSQSTSATSPSAPGLSVSDGSSTNSGTTSSTASIQPVGLASTHRKSLATGAIVGIVVGILFLILLVLSLVWLRRRRRDQQTTYPATPFSVTSSDADASPPPNLPSNDSDSRSISSSGGPLLQPEWHIPREKMMPIADRNLILSTHSTSNTGSSAPDPDVMAQLREVRARVLELEAQLESPRARRPSTPPPGYSGEER